MGHTVYVFSSFQLKTKITVTNGDTEDISASESDREKSVEKPQKNGSSLKTAKEISRKETKDSKDSKEQSDKDVVKDDKKRRRSRSPDDRKDRSEYRDDKVGAYKIPEWYSKLQINRYTLLYVEFSV